MKYQLSARAEKDYVALSKEIRKSTRNKFEILVTDIRYPSLRAKKYDETTGLWQGRINKEWRFYFLILRDTYYIISIRKHKN